MKHCCEDYCLSQDMLNSKFMTQPVEIHRASFWELNQCYFDIAVTPLEQNQMSISSDEDFFESRLVLASSQERETFAGAVESSGRLEG